MEMSLPAGYSAPAYSSTSVNSGGWAIIASATGLVVTMLFAAVRLYTRYPFRSRLLYDDAAIVVATVFAIIQAGLIMAAVPQGLGKSNAIVDAGAQSRAKKIIYASELFYLLSLFLSRISVLFLEHALSPERLHQLLAKGGLAVSLVMTVAAVFMIAFGCDSKMPWLEISNECDALYTRWVIVVTFGIVIEVLIFAIIMRMLSCLQRDWQGKLKAVVVFALRLPVIVVAVYRLLELRNFRTTPDPMFDRVLLVAWTQGELAYSLVMATVPSLMPFLTKLNTGLGALSRDDYVAKTQQGSGGSFTLQSLKPSALSASGSRMRPDNVQYKSTVVSQIPERRSISSDDSQRVMVRKTVDISYSEETSGIRYGQ